MAATTKSALTEAEWKRGTPYRETREEQFKRKKNIAYALVGVIAVVCAGIIAALVTWYVLRDPPVNPGLTGTTQAVGKATLEIPRSGAMILRLPIPGKAYPAIIHLGTMLDTAKHNSIECDNSDSDACYKIETDTTNYTLALTYTNYTSDFACVQASWTTDLDRRLTDCLELGSSHWYGGGLLYEHRWPMSLKKDMTAFKSADIMQVKTDFGSVLEPYWVSSDGVGISVKFNAKDQPLHTSWNNSGDGKLCIESRFRDSAYVYAGNTALNLDHTVCTGSDIANLHRNFLKYVQPWKKPTDVPSAALFERPIWSTWVSYKTTIKQSDVLQFMDKINSSGFKASNIEIDDGYHINYGDYSFNPQKFPNPQEIFNEARKYNFNVTTWVYPFVNIEAKSFAEGFDNEYFVWTPNNKVPAMTWWWQGKLAALIDYTNPKASKWYFDRLKDFSSFGFESFKFDGGESNWMPIIRQFHEQSVSPDYYGRRFAEEANAHFGKGLEVRVGLHTQHVPVFVRMLDKDSVVGYDNGLRSLIPTALTFGLLGYPFILPDMIGGNAYRNGSTVPGTDGLLENNYPSDRLFLRWLGATVFLPSIQFSTTPWHYESASKHEPTKTSVRLLAIREKYTDTFLQLAKESVDNGYPIIRPLWWINGTDVASWEIDDQFLVGNNLMVAPVLDENLDHRKIYIPPGSWFDNLRNNIVTGPRYLENYVATLHEVPTFSRRD